MPRLLGEYDIELIIEWLVIDIPLEKEQKTGLKNWRRKNSVCEKIHGAKNQWAFWSYS